MLTKNRFIFPLRYDNNYQKDNDSDGDDDYQLGQFPGALEKVGFNAMVYGCFFFYSCFAIKIVVLKVWGKLLAIFLLEYALFGKQLFKPKTLIRELF